MVIVEDQVDKPREIEGDDEQPKQRTDPDREQRQHGQHAGCKIPVGGEHGEACGQIGADHARKDEDEPEEAEAVQRSDRTLCFEMVHRFEPGPDVHAEAKQPRDIA